MSAEERPGPALQVDKWGLRYQSSLGDLGEAKPASWRQVWRQVNRHLMRLVSGLPRLLAEAVEGVTRLARSTIPRQAAAKVEAAHAEAEFWEDALRRDRLALGDPKQRRRDARRAIEAVLERYRREGHLAGVVAGPGGRPVLVIVRGGSEPPALPTPSDP